MSHSQPPGSHQSTGRLVVIVVGILIGVVLLCVGGLAVAGYYFASRFEVRRELDAQGREKTVRLETPFGRLRVDKGTPVDPERLGIPLYPGATVSDRGRSTRLDLDLDIADQYLRVIAVEMETPDPAEKVIEFYRQTGVDFVFSRRSDGKVEFRWEEGALKKVVAIVGRGGKTRISLAHVGEPEAN